MDTSLQPIPRARNMRRSRALPRLRNAVHDFGPALAFAAIATFAIELAVPAPAAADLNPIHIIGGLLGDAAGLGTGLFVRGFLAILNALFAGAEAKLTLAVLTWLTSLDNQTGGQITSLYHLTSGMALGLLAAVLSVSIARYWIAGLSQSGSGGFEAIEALLRTLFAVGLLLVWPFFFGQLVALSNIASATILSAPALRAQITHIINTVVFFAGFAPSGEVTVFIALVVAIAGALLFLALLFMKVMIGATVTFLYVAMPLAIIVWPVPELSWLARYAARAFLSLLIVPIVWALIFATFAAVSVNALEFTGAHGFVNQVTQPLVALAMLLLTITIPRTLFKLAASPMGMGRHGGGFVSRAGSFLAARQAQEFLAASGMLPFGRNGFVTATAGANGGGQRGRTPTQTPTPTGGAGANGSPAAATLVTVPVAAAGAAAGGAVAGPAGGAAGGVGGVFRSPGGVIVPARGNEPATGPSVASHRPQRDHPNPVDARVPTTDASLKALEAARDQARNAPAPSDESTREALDRLGPAVQSHLHNEHERGGPLAARGAAIQLAISDRISNRQAQDLMQVAAAANHNRLGPILGTTPGEPGTFTSPSDRSAVPDRGNAPAAPAARQIPPASPPPHPPAPRPEQHPRRAVRDEAWDAEQDS